MPRTARSIAAGMVYHVLNRGNGHLRLFHKEADYHAFERLLVEGLKRYPVDLLTYCLTPNHLVSCRQAADRRGLGAADGLGGCDARPPAPRALSPPWRGALVPGAIQELSRGRGQRTQTMPTLLGRRSHR